MESVIDGLQWKRVVSFVSWNSHSAITLVQWRKAVIRRGLLNTLGWIWRKLKRLEEVENHASMTGWQKLFFSYKMLLTFGGRYNCYFWDTRLKILRLLNFNFPASGGLSRRGVFVFTKSWSCDQVMQKAYLQLISFWLYARPSLASNQPWGAMYYYRREQWQN